MENCLVKQYRTAVNNPNLDYFDALYFRIDWSVYSEPFHVFTLKATGNLRLGGLGVKAKIVKNGLIYDENDDTHNEYTLTNITSGTVYIKPVDVNEVTEFILIGLSKFTKVYNAYSGGVSLRNPEKLKYCLTSNVTPVDNKFMVYYPFIEDEVADYDFLKDITEDVSTVTSLIFASVRNEINGAGLIKSRTGSWKKFVNVTELSYWCYITEGDIAELAPLTKLTNLSLRHPGVVGDIAALGTMTSITNMNLNGSGISGSIEDFVAAQRQNGRTTASRITIRCSGSYHSVTYNGTVIKWNPKYISWDAQGNITVEDS